MDDQLWIGTKKRTADELATLSAAAQALVGERDVSFAETQAFCLFIGYPRSGHTFVASLLDAHRHTMLANELDVLELVAAGFTRDQILHALNESALVFGAGGSQWTGYDYKVPGQWQGRCESLRVIGDKKAGRTVRWLVDDPRLLERLESVVRLPLKLIHVIRNPYDNVATRWLRTPQQTLDKMAERQFALALHVDKLKKRVGDRILDVRHEDVIANPQVEIRRMCAFLGLDAPDDYVDAAAGIVFASPNKSRHKIEWTPSVRKFVAERTAAHDFLRQYTFDD
jgi:hypothetical protein